MGPVSCGLSAGDFSGVADIFSGRKQVPFPRLADGTVRTILLEAGRSVLFILSGRQIVTDQLRSYGAAMKAIGKADRQDAGHVSF